MLSSAIFKHQLETTNDALGLWPRAVSERYEVRDVIGDGNFAVVRECMEYSTGRRYALKIIDKAKCAGKVTEWSI